MNDTGILLIAHGSPLPFNELIFNKIQEKISQRTDIKTQIGYVKLSEPTIDEAINKLDTEKIIAQPLMLSDGKLTKKIIPEKIPDTVKLLDIIDVEKVIKDIIDFQIEKALTKSQLNKDADTEILLITHGSRMDDNKVFLKEISEIYDSKSDYETHYAFMKFNKPRIHTVADEIKSERLIVVPIFVAPGVHTMTDIPIILGLMDPPEPCPFMKDGKHHPDHAEMHGHGDDPLHRPQHHSLKTIKYNGEVLFADTIGDDDRLIDLWVKNILENI